MDECEELAKWCDQFACVCAAKAGAKLIIDGADSLKTALEDHKNFRRIAVLLRAPQPACPEGWRLVPVEPTDDMCIAGGDAQTRSFGSWGEPAVVWRAMLAAAREAAILPPPPTGA